MEVLFRAASGVATESFKSGVERTNRPYVPARVFNSRRFTREATLCQVGEAVLSRDVE